MAGIAGGGGWRCSTETRSSKSRAGGGKGVLMRGKLQRRGGRSRSASPEPTLWQDDNHHHHHHHHHHQPQQYAMRPPQPYMKQIKLHPSGCQQWSSQVCWLRSSCQEHVCVDPLKKGRISMCRRDEVSFFTRFGGLPHAEARRGNRRAHAQVLWKLWCTKPIMYNSSLEVSLHSIVSRFAL